MARVEFNSGDTPKNYPSNSNKAKAKEEQKAHPPAVQPVISNGGATIRKKGIFSKIIGSFISEDVDDIGGYLFKDVVVPAVQDTLVNSIKDTADMLFYGEARSSNRARRGYSNSNYTVYSKSGRPQNAQSNQRPTANNRAMHRFDSLEFEDYGRAKDVIDSLNDYIFEYESATVGTFYDFANVSHTWADVNFGWYDVSMVKPRRIRNGNWVLDLPKPVQLK